ncbi:MAG TPA: hypothetical protein VFQ85_12310 [Mycobacteriales bacterium]|nr:hypothetical protein [Mycobacteriales bacterium]
MVHGAGGGAPARFVGTDPADGGRVEVPAETGTILVDVAGTSAWGLDRDLRVVRYDVRTRTLADRWTGLASPGPDGPVRLTAHALRADGGGAYVLAGGDGHDVLLRLTPGGGVAWSTRLPGPGPGHGAAEPRHEVAVSGDSVYVVAPTGDGDPAPTHAWRVRRSGGALVTHRLLPLGAVRAGDVDVEASPTGVVAVVDLPGAGSFVRLVRLDPGDLRPTADVRVGGFLSMTGDGDRTWVFGYGRCTPLLARYDTATLRRTGRWVVDAARQAFWVAAAGGRPWLLRTRAAERPAVWLERFDPA